MENNNELEKFLYPNVSKFFPLIQRVFATKEKKVLLWMPGKSHYINKIELIRKAQIFGYTGKSFSSAVTTMDEQSYQIHWLGIDIDDIENITETSKKIEKILPNANIRISTGGKGLHIIHRIEPVEYLGNACKLVENWQKNWVMKLEDEGIKVCKYDSRTFFLHGGKNKWIKQTNKILHLEKPIINMCMSCGTEKKQTPATTIFFGHLAPLLQKFLKKMEEKKIKLITKGMIPTIQGIWIKEIYEALKEDKLFKFKTKSQMKSQSWHCNGWMIISKNTLVIRGFVDEKNCIEIFDDSEI